MEVLLAILAGVILACLLIPLFSPRLFPFFITAIGALMVIGGAWGYYKQFDKDVASNSTSPNLSVPNDKIVQHNDKTIQHKGKTYTLHHLDGKEVYVAE